MKAEINELRNQKTIAPSSKSKSYFFGKSLVVQWLRLHVVTAKGRGSIPGWGIKIPQATQCIQKKKKKPYFFGKELTK